MADCGRRTLFRVLSFAVPKGPVLLTDLDETDKHVLATQLHTLLQSIGNRLVERFLLFDGSTVVEGDLNEDAIGRASDAQVAGVDAEIFGWMLIDDLEAVILGHIQRRAHRVVDDFAHGAAIIGWLAPSEIDSN